jgi:chloride channel protein, CIC family
MAGALSIALTGAVYAAEDAFAKLPIHWMWWPALGGLFIGTGGYFFPQALGVGYETIGALGGVESWFLPNLGPGFWPLTSMAAILGGTMRSPLTGLVFAIELTHDVNMLLPLLVAVSMTHALTVLVLKRSILTEKIAPRGYHITREYAIDPLEILFTREVMRGSVVALPIDASLERLAAPVRVDALGGPQRLYPVVGANGSLEGVVTRFDLHGLATRAVSDPNARLETILRKAPTVAHPDEPLRVIVHRMAETGAASA